MKAKKHFYIREVENGFAVFDEHPEARTAWGTSWVARNLPDLLAIIEKLYKEEDKNGTR